MHTNGDGKNGKLKFDESTECSEMVYSLYLKQHLKTKLMYKNYGVGMFGSISFCFREDFLVIEGPFS